LWSGQLTTCAAAVVAIIAAHSRTYACGHRSQQSRPRHQGPRNVSSGRRVHTFESPGTASLP
jgi:hypothetical protein